MPARHSGSLRLDLRPWRLLARGMLVAGVVLPHLPGRPGFPCPIRALTGVPCPLCGMSTSVEATLGGHAGVAVAANPFGAPLVVAAIAMVIAYRLRSITLPRPLVVTSLAAILAASWLFELFRFHVL